MADSGMQAVGVERQGRCRVMEGSVCPALVVDRTRGQSRRTLQHRLDHEKLEQLVGALNPDVDSCPLSYPRVQMAEGPVDWMDVAVRLGAVAGFAESQSRLFGEGPRLRETLPRLRQQ